MNIRKEGQWSNRCDLCNDRRVLESAKLRTSDQDVECHWCKAVRLKYGDYFYPIGPSEAHLFKPKQMVYAMTEDQLKKKLDEAFKKGAESQIYYGA